MNRFAKLSVFALISVLMLTTCSSKQSPVDDLTELSYKLQEDSENYSSKDWESAITKYAQIEKDLQQYEYTDEELKEIGRLKAKCAKAMMKSSGKLLKSQFHILEMQLEGASEELEGAFDEFIDVIKDSK